MYCLVRHPAPVLMVCLIPVETCEAKRSARKADRAGGYGAAQPSCRPVMV
jgi:chloramphenicol 3-O-phosphotransferase